MLGKIEDRRRREQQRMKCLDGITNSIDMNLGKFQEMVRDREAWHAAVHGVTKSWTRLGNWTTTTKCTYCVGVLLPALYRLIVKAFPELNFQLETENKVSQSVQSLSRVRLFVTP